MAGKVLSPKARLKLARTNVTEWLKHTLPEARDLYLQDRAYQEFLATLPRERPCQVHASAALKSSQGRVPRVRFGGGKCPGVEANGFDCGSKVCGSDGKYSMMHVSISVSCHYQHVLIIPCLFIKPSIRFLHDLSLRSVQAQEGQWRTVPQECHWTRR